MTPETEEMIVMYHNLNRWLSNYDVIDIEIKGAFPNLYTAIQNTIEKMDGALADENVSLFKYHLNIVKERYLKAYTLITEGGVSI